MWTSPTTPTGAGVPAASSTWMPVLAMGGPISTGAGAGPISPAADHTVVSVGP
jgi:hypothetical protein